MGEDLEDYVSIWSYMEGEIEFCFKLYEYFEFEFYIIEWMSNLEVL